MSRPGLLALALAAGLGPAGPVLGNAALEEWRAQGGSVQAPAESSRPASNPARPEAVAPEVLAPVGADERRSGPDAQGQDGGWPWWALPLVLVAGFVAGVAAGRGRG